MNDDGLRAKLKTWKVEPEIPARFQAEVWARIAARDAARDASPWRQFLRGLLAALDRPAYATAAIALTVVVSLGAARMQSDSANARGLAQLEMRYVNSIDPNAPAHGHSLP